MKNKRFNKKINSKRKNDHKKFGKEGHSRRREESRIVDEVKISDINFELSEKVVAISGVIDRIVQTKGPTIFVVSDGTGILGLKGFECPGERAYPELNEGETVKAIVTIGEFKGELEGEIKKITKLDKEEHKEYLGKILNLQRKRAEIEPINFLVDSKILDKLRERFIKAATEIRLAIIRGRPIIVRHHNDTDGYCSGYALEKAILPLIIKEQLSEKAP